MCVAQGVNKRELCFAGIIPLYFHFNFLELLLVNFPFYSLISSFPFGVIPSAEMKNCLADELL